MAIERLYPNAVGYYTGFTTAYPFGSDPWEVIDDPYDSPNDDDYIYVLADNARGSYNITASGLSGNATINSVCVKFRAKGSTTTLAMKGFVFLNGVGVEDYYQTLTTSFADYNTGTRLTRPGGGNWAVADLENLEIGVRCSGAAKGTTHYCSQLYVEIDYTAESGTEATARIAGKIVGDKTTLSRIAENALGDKISTSRLSHLPHLVPSEFTERVSHKISFAAFDPTWWNTNYYKRRKIEFGNSHSALAAGHKVQFEIFTGYEQIVAENGINNEGIAGLPGIAYHNNCTYIAWMAYSSTPGANSRVYIRKYNQGTDTWTNAIDVSDIGTYFDGHFAPSILVDSNGYIHLFYGCHNSDLKYRKSSNAEDVTLWGSEQTIGAGYNFTYPHPVEAANGDLYVFGRQYVSGKSYLVFYKSTNGGNSWTTPQMIVDYSSNYGGNSSIYVADVRIDSNGRCHLFFTFWDYYEAANLGRAVCYIYSDDYSSWYNIAGDWLGVTDTVPLDYSADCKVAISPNFPSAGPYYGEGTITLDDFNRPYLYYYSWTTSIQEQSRAYFAKWTGIAWSITELTALSGSPLMMNRRFTRVAYVDHQGNVYCYGIVLPNTTETYFGGELYLWRGANYGESWTHYYLTKNTYGGAGVICGLPKIFDGHYREIAYCRGKTIYYLQDISYPYIQSTGDDVRIILHRLGETDIEIDRLPDRFNAEDTRIFFPVNSNATVPENRSQPHAYKAYYVYYSYYNASNPARNVSNIFTLYENFESYASGSDLHTQGGWSGDSGVFKVCNYSDTTTYADAHTQKLYGGKNFLVANAPGGAKSITKLLPLSSHYVTISIWTDLSVSGDKFYIELYDANSSKYFRAGIQYNLFAYMKSGETWINTTKGAAANNYHEVKIKINSSGITFWGDGGAALLVDDNHITECTSIKIGVDSVGGKVIYDALQVYPSVAIEPTLTLGTIEGADTPGTARLAHSSAAHKVMTIREANSLIMDTQKLQRIAQWLATDKTLTARAAQSFGLNKSNIARLSETIGLDKASFIRLMNIIIADKADIARCAHNTATQYARTIRIIHSLVVDKMMTARLTHLPPTAIVGIERLSNIVSLDKAILRRLSHAVVPDKYIISRVAEYLQTEKQMTSRLAAILNLEDEDTKKLAEKILTDKELVIRLSHDLEPDKVFVSRIASLISLEDTAMARLAAWCALEATSFVRIAELLSLSKETFIRLAQGAFPAGAETVRLANLIAGNKTITYRLPETISVDKLILTRLAMSAPGNKTLTRRIAEFLALEATGTTRIAESMALNKVTMMRLANALTLWFIRAVRLAMLSVPNKWTESRLGMKVPIYFRDLFGFYITDQDLKTINLKGYEIKNLSLTDAEIKRIQIINSSII